MQGKFKLTTFIGSRVTSSQRSHKNFGKVLTFLPQLYAAHLSPQEWTGGAEQRPSMEDEFFYPGTVYFQYVEKALSGANRAELHVYTLENQEDDLAVEVEFFNGKTPTGDGIIFSFTLSNGRIGAGYLGINRRE